MTSEEQIALLKKNKISVGCGVLSLLLVAGLYFRSDAIPAAEAQFALKMAEAERLATNIKYADKLKEHLDALVVANKAIDTQIVRASQVGINTQYFYKLESDTGVKLGPLVVAAPAKGAKTAFTPVAFNVSAQGSLLQILDFLRRLEGGTRYSRVMTASVSGTVTNRNVPLSLSLTVELLGMP